MDSFDQRSLCFDRWLKIRSKRHFTTDKRLWNVIFTAMKVILIKSGTMKGVYGTFLLLLCLWCGHTASAQKNVSDTSIFMSSANISYAGQLPGGDLADRFGFNSNLGVHALFKTKSNWIFGLEGSFIFGKEVREDSILNGLLTSDGNIINVSGGFTRVIAGERGFTLALTGGRIFHLEGLAPNPNSGLEVRLGVGYLQHKIRYDVEDNNLQQLTKEYKKGYDRLSSGLMVSQFVGYRYFGNNRFINFFAGVEVMEAFTDSRRSWNYDTNSPGMTGRFDLLFGLRAGWSVPIYKRAPNDVYLY